MRSLTLFNHKGGVGKTTLTVNLASAFAEIGESVLLVDADPQCNLSAFYLPEEQLDEMLGESSDSAKGGTIWTALEPVVLGRGHIGRIPWIELDKIKLLAGDVLLSQYEEELPAAWTESFARKARGYDLMCALSYIVRDTAERLNASLVMYDVGPNVGPLNRTVLLSSDYFITPMHTDLYSLRALTTVGRSISRWITDWQTVRELASAADKKRLIKGTPRYLGYISSAYQTYGGKKAKPHEYWEKLIPSRVKSRVVDELRKARGAPEPVTPSKIGDVPDFHSMAAKAQEYGLPIGYLRGYVDSSYNDKIDNLRSSFISLAKAIQKRMEE